MQTTKLRIEGMNRPQYAGHVEKALAAVPGVKRASVTLDEGATVEHQGISVDVLKGAVAAAEDYRAYVSTAAPGWSATSTVRPSSINSLPERVVRPAWSSSVIS